MYFGEIHQDFGHLVTTLTTANVDDDITVRELGHTLGNNSLSTTEGTRNADSTTLNTGEEGIQHSLADNEGRIGGQPVANRAGNTDGPGLHHTELGLFTIKLHLEQLLFDGVAASRSNPGNGTPCTRRQQDLVVVHQTILEHATPDVTTSDVVADLEGSRLEFPLALPVQGIDRNTTGNVDTLRLVRDGFEGSLNTVVDRLHQTGAKLD